jgi:hypothetical protein
MRPFGYFGRSIKTTYIVAVSNGRVALLMQKTLTASRYDSASNGKQDQGKNPNI